MNTQKKIILKTLLPVMFGVMITGSVMAKKCDDGNAGHMAAKLERFIEHLDLNNEQETKADKIFSDLKVSMKGMHPKRGSGYLMTLNPESADYLDNVNAQAEIKASHAKAKMIMMAEAKQALFKILDDEQKEKFLQYAERRMKKLEKRKHH